MPVGQGPIRSVLPHRELEVHIANLEVTPGTDRPLLSIQIIFTALDLDEAREKSQSLLKEYLNYLCFSSNLPARIHKQIRVVEWTPGLSERDCHQFQTFPGSQLPYAVLGEEIFESVSRLMQIDVSPILKRALKWFGLGVGAEYIDAQFQFFWLTIELVVQITKSIEKVNDKCPRCQAPLYCESCQEYPSHRPYPKQAIKGLFDRTIKNGSEELFALANLVRNAIAHGEDLNDLEKEQNFLLSDVVNHVGQLAWTALLNEFLKVPDAREAIKDLSFLSTNMYVRQILTMTVHLRVYSSDPQNPTLSEVAKPTLSLDVHEKPPKSP